MRLFALALAALSLCVLDPASALPLAPNQTLGKIPNQLGLSKHDDLSRRQDTFQMCVGTSTYTTSSGTIRDHTGPEGSHYLNQRQCGWVIDVGGAADAIGFEFDKFDTELRYDFVAFSIGTNPFTVANQVRWYSGSTVPEPFTIPSGKVSIWFYSDQLINGEGFRLRYSAQNCPSDCNGHGRCSNGACVCDEGWLGASCDQAYCPADQAGKACGAHGTCLSNNVCECDDGYYGWDCSDEFCSAAGGVHTMRSDAGNVTDHRGDGLYLNWMNCSWTIQPAGFDSGDSIEVHFSRFDTEEDFDFVSVYDGVHLLGRFSGTTLPPAIVATSGVVTVRFETDQGLERTGFMLHYRLLRCPQDCSSHGLCVAPADNQRRDAVTGICHCDHGFTGAQCELTECTHDCFSSVGAGVCQGSQCRCNAGFSGPDCGVCTTPQSCAAVSTTRCQGSSGSFTTPTGIITDHSGFGDYVPNQNCEWLIDVSGLPDAEHSSIDISFVDFDLEHDAELSFSSGNIALATYHGPGLAPPSISAPARDPLYVSFQSGPSTDVAGGFRLSYRVSTCPDCGQNGGCLRGQCVCREGWTGATCNQQTCLTNAGLSCSNHGACSSASNTCMCRDGYFGALCESQYCSGTTTYSSDTGVIADRFAGDFYRPNSHCEFLIAPQDTQSAISLVFTQFALQWTYDWVAVYDGDSTSSPLLATLQGGSFIPRPIRSSAGKMLVQFHSNEYVEFGGFQASFSSLSRCLSRCNGNGNCLNGDCICDAGFAGATCQDVVIPEVLLLNTNVTAAVSQYSWRYWKFTLPPNTAEFVVRHALFNEFGHAVFAIQKQRIPTFRDYSFAGEYYSGDNTRIINPDNVQDWYIGVYGRERSDVVIRVESGNDAPSTTSPGEISVSVSGVSPPIGEVSDSKVPAAEGNGWVVPVLVLMSIIVVVVLGGAGYVLWRNQCQGRRSMLAMGQRDWTDLIDQESSESDRAENSGGVDLEGSTGQ